MNYRLDTFGMSLNEYFKTLIIIGKGAEHIVYQHPKYKDLVIKRGLSALSHGKTFIKDSSKYPIVYDIVDCNNTTEDYIVIEKLDVDKFIKLWKKIFKTVREFQYTRQDFGNRCSSLYQDIEKNIDIMLNETLSELREIILHTAIQDIRPENFGMTTDGKIKVIDL
jgi:hypothetical protein